ncbi:MAG: DUF3341 domain-containing protein [Gemmatimonadetes bacterium]|nr:DUF3341 domain-containing protein [Gemmatimonadota bacterium]
MAPAGARRRVTALFDEPHAVVHAIEQLRKQRVGDVTVYSPIPEPDVIEATGGEVSIVRRYALLGGIVGCLSGFALTLWSSYAYPLVTGGKPIGSIPPYVIIAFELTILFTGIACIVALSLHNRMPRLRLRDDFDPRFTGDRFGIVVQCGPAEAPGIERTLREAGAVEVRVG